MSKANIETINELGLSGMKNDKIFAGQVKIELDWLYH